MARSTQCMRYSAWWGYDQAPYDPANAKSVPWWVDAQLKSWIAAVNANPSNAAKQITLHEDVTGNNSDTAGWVIQLMNNQYLATDAQSIYVQFSFKNSSSSTTCYVGGTYTPGAYLGSIAGGNGTLASDVLARPSISAEEDTWVDTYMCTEDGKELFWTLASYGTNNSKKQGLCMYKDTRGYWVAFLQENSNFTGYGYYLNRYVSSGNKYGNAQIHRAGMYSGGSSGSWLRNTFLMGPNDNQNTTSASCTQWWRDAACVLYYDDTSQATLGALSNPDGLGLRHHSISEVSVVAKIS